jgi:hypothetical protein
LRSPHFCICVAISLDNDGNDRDAHAAFKTALPKRAGRAFTRHGRFRTAALLSLSRFEAIMIDEGIYLFSTTKFLLRKKTLRFGELIYLTNS